MKVYMAGHEEAGPVKIGISADPEKRLAELQTGNPHRLELWGAFKPDRYRAVDVERYAHRHFGHRRLTGEWFNASMNEVGEFLQVVEFEMDRLPQAVAGQPWFPPDDCPHCRARWGRQKNSKGPK